MTSKHNKKDIFFFNKLKDMAEENNIPLPLMCDHLKAAYKEAYKDVDLDAKLKFEIDLDKRIFEVSKKLLVLDKDEDQIFEFTEISLAKAKKIIKQAKAGKEYYFPILWKNATEKFKFRFRKELTLLLDKDKNIELEKKYSKKIGELISGEVTKIRGRKGKLKISIDVGDVVAILDETGVVFNERLIPGMKIYVLVKDINLKNDGSKFILKVERNSEKFIKELFKQEIEEVADDIVKIKKIIRIPGWRTDVVVDSDESNINPVLTCIGVNGARINAIMHWINQERIYLVKYSPNIEVQFKNYYQDIDIIDSVDLIHIDLVHEQRVRVMNVWINDWERIGWFYGKYYSRVLNAMIICELFDIRIFDPNEITKEEVHEMLTKGLEKDIPEVVQTPAVVQASSEKAELEETDFNEVDIDKVQPKDEVILEKEESKIKDVFEETDDYSAKDTLISSTTTAEQIKENDISNEAFQTSGEQKTTLQATEAKSPTTIAEQQAEFITKKRKREQKTETLSFLERQRAKIGKKLVRDFGSKPPSFKDIDLTVSETEEEEGYEDDYDFDYDEDE